MHQARLSLFFQANRLEARSGQVSLTHTSHRLGEQEVSAHTRLASEANEANRL